jgi:dTDP-4-amino-4,6-dideoxygalactose transaminase
MPNLNAALGCAQIERLEESLVIKNKIANQWDVFFDDKSANFVKAIKGNKANHWLNTIILDSREERDNFLKFTNQNNVMTRPIWTLMSKLSMFKDCQKDSLANSLWLEDRVVNIPSSVPDRALKKMGK